MQYVKSEGSSSGLESTVTKPVMMSTFLGFRLFAIAPRPLVFLKVNSMAIDLGYIYIYIYILDILDRSVHLHGVFFHRSENPASLLP